MTDAEGPPQWPTTPQPEGHQPPEGYQPPGYQPPPQSPGYQSPGYQSPGYQSPGYQSPGYQSPGYQPPYQQPGYQPPYQAPAGVPPEPTGGPNAAPPEHAPYATGQWLPPPVWQPGGAGVPPTAPAPHRRSTKPWIAAAVAVVVAIGLTIFFVARSGGSTKGAASPQAAVQVAASAIQAQDIDKAFTVVNPGEARTLHTIVNLIRSKTASTKLIAARGLLLPYVDLSITDLQTSVDQPTSSLAFVSVTGGTARATVDEAKLPAGARPAQPQTTEHTADLGGGTGNLRVHVAGNGFDVPGAGEDSAVIATVKVDGGWYLSPTTTLMENIRRGDHLASPNFGAGAVGNGATTPEGAIQGLITAANRRDSRATVGYLSPQDTPALRYYFAEFADEIMRNDDGNGHLQVSDLDTTVQNMSNGLKKVVINSLRFRAGSDDDSTNGSYQSLCVTNDRHSSGASCVAPSFTKLSGITNAFVVVDRENGSWRISPTATVLEYLRVLFTNGSTDAIYRELGLFTVLAPTRTVPAGHSATVQLNDAGFINIAVTAAPGACLDLDALYNDEPDDLYIDLHPGQYVQGSCGDDGVSIPSTGLNLFVVGSITGAPHDVTIRLPLT